MDDLSLLLDLHVRNARQGPGGAAQTRLALHLSGLEARSGLRIADLGCGTGASTLILAECLDADIIALDFAAPFLAELLARAARAGLASRIETVCADLAALPFAPASLDAIWSEGAIYTLGFEAGLRDWRTCLKPGGILAVSELTWLSAERPAELTAHWQREYPGVATAGEKIAQLEAAGYMPVGYFPLPPSCWLDNYYRPLEAAFAGFIERHPHDEAAQAIIAAERIEIDLYERHTEFVSYGFYIARKI